MLKVLIVEDEEIVRKGLEVIIDWLKLDCKVIGLAANAKEGLNLIKELKPDIVMTDINMPDMTGLEMIEEAKKISHFHTIVLSGYSDFEYAKEAIKLDVDAYLLKPIDESELEEAIDKIKAKRKKAKEMIDNTDASKTTMEIDMLKIFKAAETNVDTYVKDVYKIIKERYMEKLSINDIAEDIGVSTSFLSRRLKQKLNISFVDLLNQYRINRSIELLKNSDMKIYEISHTVGFNEYKYFCSVFKTYTGTSPTDFMKNSNIINTK